MNKTVKRTAFLIAGALPLCLGLAQAQADTQIGISAKPMPFGKMVSSDAAGKTTTGDAAMAYGVAPTVEYFVNPYLSLGLAPQFILNVNAKNAAKDVKASNELDLMARLTGWYPITDKVRVYGYAAPGYSFILLPKATTAANQTQPKNPSGFAVGFGAGTAVNLTDSLYLSAEAGYQMGFQKTKTTDATTKKEIVLNQGTRFPAFSIGLGTKF